MTALELAVIEAVIKLALNREVRAEVVALFSKHGMTIEWQKKALADQAAGLDSDIAKGDKLLGVIAATPAEVPHSFFGRVKPKL